MRTLRVLALAVGIAAVVSAFAPADIIVLNNGQVFTGEVSSDATGRFKLTTDYGEQFFPASQVAGRFTIPPGKEAEAFYQAGLLAMSKGQRNTARQLFEQCIKYNASYRDRCVSALQAGASPVAPGPAAPGTTPGVVSPPRPQAQRMRIQCSECSGSGVIMSSSSLSESTRERPRPCPICGGKGYKDLTIPPGYELCSNCGGFGASAGGGKSDTSSFILKKDMCPRCAARGYVKEAWKPAEATDGTGSPGTVMMSPAPGTPPPHTGGSLNVAKQQAQDVASGPQTSRPVGPSSIRPTSPTMISSPPSPEPREEEVIEEDEGSSAEGSSTEGSEESESEEEKEEDFNSVSSDYAEPGFTGWISRHKWHVVMGGVAVLIFAVMFNKMSAKK